MDLTKNLYVDETVAQLRAGGVFLAASDGTKTNIMTIGWGSLGVMWSQPVFVAPVRHSRYSHGLIVKNGEFTVCVPGAGQMKDELIFCGTKSGRDVDKAAELGLTLLDSDLIRTKLIDRCSVSYECKVIGSMEMDPAAVDSGLFAQFYPQPDLHTLFYGRIMAAHKM